MDRSLSPSPPLTEHSSPLFPTVTIWRKWQAVYVSLSAGLLGFAHWFLKLSQSPSNESTCASQISARYYKHAASTPRTAVRRLIDRHSAFIIACASYWYPSLSRDHNGWTVPNKDYVDHTMKYFSPILLEYKTYTQFLLKIAHEGTKTWHASSQRLGGTR